MQSSQSARSTFRPSRPHAVGCRRLDLSHPGEAGRGGYAYPASQTRWQEIYRSQVDQLSEGMVMKNAVEFQRVAQTFGVPRENH